MEEREKRYRPSCRNFIGLAHGPGERLECPRCKVQYCIDPDRCLVEPRRIPPQRFGINQRRCRRSGRSTGDDVRAVYRRDPRPVGRRVKIGTTALSDRVEECVKVSKPLGA